MISCTLQTIWTGAELHVWGEEAPLAPRSGETAPEARPQRHPFALSQASLRAALGEVCDVLWVQDLRGGELTLRLPTTGGAPWRSTDDPPAAGLDAAGLVLRAWFIPTLVLSADDAVDWLAGLPQPPHHPALSSASVRFWSRAAAAVLDLLARQRFVPDLRRAGPTGFQGWWRAVPDERTELRLRRLIDDMPVICRAFAAAEGPEPQPLDLMDSFLRETVDGLVRRWVEEDELAEAVTDQLTESPSLPARWLASLVQEDRALTGTLEEREAIHERVRGWLATLEPDVAAHRFRTLLRLEEPEDDADAGLVDTQAWRLTFHLQSMEAPHVVLDASALPTLPQRSAILISRPMEDLQARLKADLQIAARHFEPLRPVLQETAPQACDLTLREAYHFLRHVTPLLTLEGMAVEAPEWWGRRRPRVGLRMRLRPVEAGAARAAGLGVEALVNFDWRLAVGDESVSPEDLRRWIHSDQPLARVGRAWMEVDADAIREALGFLDRQETSETTLIEALHRAFVSDPSERALPVVDVVAEGWLGDLLLGKGEGQAFRVVAPPTGFEGTLRPYQLRGVSWLDFLDRHGLGACLADDMGLGKTIQLIALLLHERQEGLWPGATLIVVPMSVVGNWQREAHRFAPSLKVMVHHGLERLSGDAFVEEVARHDVVISTYGLVHRDLEHLARVTWHRLVLDEAQNVKNPAAKQAAAVRRLQARRRVAMTGTPIENRLGELWSILDFLNPSLLGSAGEFRRLFASPIERHRDADVSERLRKLIRPFVLRRAKSDPDVDVDLPQKLEMNVFCNLTREQAVLYEQVTSQMLGRIDQAGGIQRRGLVLTAIMRLKQICNHPAQFLGETRAAAERSGKCDRLLEMLEEVVAEGDSALVFTQFRQMGELLVGLLEPLLDRSILFLHGGTPEPKRRQIVDDFQAGGDRHPVLVLSLKAGGVGLNLTAANHVFHFDRWWNPAVEDQATDRAHRIGQSRKVQVHKFVCVGTLEERIDAMLHHKKDLAEKIIGSGEEWLTELSTDRLRELFRLSQDAVSD